MTLAKAKARANETFKVQVSHTIVTYNSKNIFIVQATAWASDGKFYDTTRWFPDFIFDHLTGSMSDFDTFLQFLETKSPLDYVTEGRIGVHVFKILFCSLIHAGA
jgi:hypothetical protein